MNEDQSGRNEPKGKSGFRCNLPTFPEGPVTFAEAEAMYLERIESSGGDDIEALYQLSVLYSSSEVISIRPKRA